MKDHHVKVKSLSHVQLFVTPWTAAYQAPPSVGFSRQEYWSGVPLPSPKTYSRKGQTVYVFGLFFFFSFTARSQEKWELRGINYVYLVSPSKLNYQISHSFLSKGGVRA